MLAGLIGVLGWVNLHAGAQIVAEQIAPSTVRFYASPASQTSAKPSVAIEGNWPTLGGLPPGFSVIPVFSDPGGGNSRVTVSVPAGSNVYGTGLVAGPLERTGRLARLYNEDSYQWGDSDQQLYQSHPWVLVVRADGSAFGVLFDSTWKSTIDLTAPVANGIRFQQTSAAGYPPVIVIDRSNPADVVKALSDLTGRPFMPPLWSIGFHQSRYSYTPAARALEVAQGFRDRRIPADTIWFDIDYMSGAKNFTFNAFTFPNPAATNASLHALGFSSVWIIDPGTKQDTTYSIFTSGLAGNHFVKQANQTTDQSGTVWPGTCVWPDFTRAETRQWWAGLFPSFLARGADGVWNDMNEPSLFNVAGGTMPDNAWHRADAAFGGPGTHQQFHNIYGMQMARATREGILQSRPALRPFVLSRSNYLGGQKYAATWTGDNSADWYHLDVTISNVLNLGLSGQPNSGSDIGGYSGDNSAGVYGRWIGIGAMMPFSRAHTEKGTPDKEPWAFDAPTEGTARLALQRRYQLLPYFYTLFHEASTTGMPVARPLFFAEPANPALRTRDNEFLLGDGLVVACATDAFSLTPEQPPMTGPLYRFALPLSNLPGAASDAEELNLPSLYLRGGSIIPVSPIRQYANEAPLDVLTLIVALDSNSLASGMLYEDAGDGWGFQQGDYRLSKYSAFLYQNQVHVTLDTVWGSRPAIERRCIVRLLTGDLTELRAEGRDGDEIIIDLPGRPVTLDARHIDGRLLTNAFEAVDLLASQTTPAGNLNNANELDAMWVRPEIGGVRIGLSGNLGTDSSAVAIFLDTQTGGQNLINTSALASPPAGLAAITNTRLESGFDADRLLWVSLSGVTVRGYWIELNSGGASTIRMLGRRLLTTAGFGQLAGGINPTGIDIAIDNTNTAGIDGAGMGHPLTATTGIEIFIPDAALGPGASPCRPVQIMAALVGPDGTFRSQVLPPVAGSGSLGKAPNFADLPGTQVVQGFATLVNGDVNLDGVIDVEDLYAWEQGQGVRDVNRDGIVNSADREWLTAVIRCREAELDSVGRR